MDTVNISDKISIWLTDDKLKAHINISQDIEKNNFSLNHILEVLKAKNVIYGINQEIIKNIIENEMFNRDLIVAYGKPPINGKDTEVEFFFNPILFEDMKQIEEEDGSINHYSRGKINMVNEGDPLVSITMYTEGEPGISVTGSEIKSQKGRHRIITAGKNIRSGEDGLSLNATISGYPKLIKDTIQVAPYFEIKDVDLSTGHIDFDGNVLVTGNVRSGFKVNAGGDLTIHGNIHHAEVSAKGNITTHGGKIAGDHGLIKSGKDIHITFIEGGTIQANNNIHVKRAIINTHVEAGNSVFCEEEDGVIIGGIIKATHLIQANKIGSNYHTKTDVILGFTEESKHRLKKIDKMILEKKEIYINKNKTYEQCKKVVDTVDGKTDLDKDSIARITVVYKQITSELEKLIVELNQLIDLHKLLTAASKIASSPKLSISGDIYPGVDITINNSFFDVSRVYTNKTLTEKNNQIRMYPYIQDPPDNLEETTV